MTTVSFQWPLKKKVMTSIAEGESHAAKINQSGNMSPFAAFLQTF